MGHQLMRITPSIVAAAREYVELKSTNCLSNVHIAECFPVRPETVLEIWESALFELRRRPGAADFHLAFVIVFKEGGFAAEYVPLNSPEDQQSLFD